MVFLSRLIWCGLLFVGGAILCGRSAPSLAGMAAPHAEWSSTLRDQLANPLAAVVRLAHEMDVAPRRRTVSVLDAATGERLPSLGTADSVPGGALIIRLPARDADAVSR